MHVPPFTGQKPEEYSDFEIILKFNILDFLVWT
jgi:hypothetical protein